MDSDPRAIPGTSKDAIKGDLCPVIGTGLPHASGGVKTSLHGTIYQIKLAMFFIVRALMQNFVFEIGTEVDAAESFDDLVFEFENDKEKVVIFLQAKHRHDELKTINEIDLLNADGHFSMRKYCSSYCNILESKYFKNILKDAKVSLVISTNIDIADSIKDKFEENSVGEFASNGLLHPGPAAAYAKFYKIKKGTPFYDNLVTLLEKDEIPLTLAQLLAKTVVNNKKKSIKIDDQFKRYREWLLDRIFDYGNETVRKQNRYFVSFKKDFLSNKNKDLHKFKEIFIQTFIHERNNQNVTEDTINAELDEVKFQVPKDFIFGGVTKQNKAIEFIDALIFAVNQPSEDKLGEIVEKEVGEYARLTDRKSVACKFQTFITDWVKQKEGRFLKKEDAEEQFAVWGQTDLSHKNINELKGRSYIFELDDVIVNISNFLKDGNEQIICLYYSEQFLTEIKLCQALGYEGDINNEFIFSDINILSEQVNTKMCPVKAFKSQSCNNVFMIIRKNSEVKQKEEMLLRRLLDIVKTDIQNGQKLEGKKTGKAKKRILMLIPLKHVTINERNDFFQDLDSEGIHRIILEDTEVNFSNLNDDSKKKLFEKGLFKLVGNEIGTQTISIFNDFSLPSIWNGLRQNLVYEDKPLDAYLNNLIEMLSRFVKDEVLTGLISGDSEVYKDIINNYDGVTKEFSEKVINGDVLSTIIHECTRADTTNEEKAMSFVFHGLSLITPIIEKIEKM